MFAFRTFSLLFCLPLTLTTEEGSGLTDFDEDYVEPVVDDPLPGCSLTNVPEFIDTLKKHIKSVNRADELDCTRKPGFGGEICKYSDDWADGDTSIIIKWNDCGKISFTCNVHSRDLDYAPTLPTEVTNLGLNGDCPADNTLIYTILGIVGTIGLILLAVVGGYFFKKKK